MTSAVIVAAGKGTRMGPQVDKLFLELNGCPVVAHTWRQFDKAECIDEILLVVRDGMQGAFEALAEQYHFKKSFRLVAGGKERQDSVWNGLEALSPGTEIVAIQDAARPCTSPALIAATVAAALSTQLPVSAPAVSGRTITVPGASWPTAAWLIAHANTYGIDSVACKDKTWTRAHGWKAATGTTSGVVATMAT